MDYFILRTVLNRETTLLAGGVCVNLMGFIVRIP